MFLRHSDFVLVLMTLLCPVRTCWHKHRSVRVSANQRALYDYAKHVLTEPKQSRKMSTYAYCYVVAVLILQRTSFLWLNTYGCVACKCSATTAKSEKIEGPGVQFFLSPFFALCHWSVASSVTGKPDC